LVAYAGFITKPYRDIKGGINQPTEIAHACATALHLAAIASFQARVAPWMTECFAPEVCMDGVERNHRFLEEALELVQARGCTRGEAHWLVDWVFSRDQGEVNQEVGGVMVTLAALCIAGGLDMHEAGETELARIWTAIDVIRAKQAAKPAPPLPAATVDDPETGEGWRPGAPGFPLAVADDVGGGP